MTNTTGPARSVDPIFVSINEAAQILGRTPWEVSKLLDARVIESVRSVRLDSIHAYAQGETA